MNQFFGTQYSQEDLERRVALRRSRNGAARNMSTSVIPQPLESSDGIMETTGMVGGDTLDDIIMQNNKEMQRRRSLRRDRRSSAMETGLSDNSLSRFQFQAPSTEDINPRRQSTGQLGMTAYQNVGSEMDAQSPPMNFDMSAQNNVMRMDTTEFTSLPTEISQEMLNYSSVDMDGIEDTSVRMNIFPNATTFSNPFGECMIPEAEESSPPHGSSMQTNDEDDMMPAIPNLRVSDTNLNISPMRMDAVQNTVEYSSSSSPVRSTMPSIPTHESSYGTSTPAPQAIAPPIGPSVKTGSDPAFDNPYSKSGFDMLAALTKVTTRENPEVNIGKVDLSCAFVVCNVLLADSPIVYVSSVFERMTGYTKHEILGRNCRFLQSPYGRVEADTHREFVDNKSVFYLGNKIAAKREAQCSIINYRKGGQPFMNLLTIIPITGEDNKEIKYYVGFQVDLVDKPTSVEGKDASGMYAVNYTQVLMPQYQWQPSPKARSYGDKNETISRENVSNMLSTIGSDATSATDREMRCRLLLENTDDVVHVLSMKGLFLYLSPSCQRLLEYDASELVGTALSAICHPSDIVPVTRTLKDTSTGAITSVIFRIRRKNSGYIWFESRGSLSAEQSKVRKCIIMVGRERPVYTLSRRDIEADRGTNENEIWSKLSMSAMFLFASSNVQMLLDRSAEELVGTSLQALMRAEARVHFARALDKARAGERIDFRHDILNKKGVAIHAQTKLYPGDAAAGRKPTFLVAQTRLLKTNPRPVAAMSTFQNNLRPGVSTNIYSAEVISTSSQAPASVQDGLPNLRPSISISGSPTDVRGSITETQDSSQSLDDNIFDELRPTHSTSWQFELRQMEKTNRLLSEELASLLSSRKKRKRRKEAPNSQRDCANCHTRVTPEWRRGPSGKRDLCNSCGLRWAKQVSRGGSDQKMGQALSESSSSTRS